MKATINVEFTDEELVKYAEDVARRVTLNAIHDVVQHIPALKLNPDLAATLAQVVAAALASAFGKKDAPPETTAGQYSSRTVCERIEASAHLEEGWVCCGCSVYNVGSRPACRNCGHVRCDIVPPNTASA